MLRVVQPPAQLYCLGHMICAGVRGARQVGNGAGHPQGAVRAAGRPAQPVGRALQELQGVVLQHHQFVHALALQRDQALLELSETCYSRLCRPVLRCRTFYTDFFDFALVRKLV